MAKLLKTLSPLRPFRCSGCDWRGYRRPEVDDGPEQSLPPLADEVKARHRGTNKDRAHVTRSRRRWWLQVTLTLLIAAIAGGLVVRLQGG